MIETLNNLRVYGQTGTGYQSGAERVEAAIALASSKTGVDFNYLLKQADIESSLNPHAKAKSSSASGLYQFIEQTWLGMVKEHGADYGYADEAEAITQNANGTYSVASNSAKKHILNLRNDAQASSFMAAELASENNAYLAQKVGDDVSGTDLYMAHFLGAKGASNFLNSMKKNPWASAESIFPQAAKANPGVFYENGRPLSLQQVYNRFDTKFEAAGVNNGTDTLVASSSQDEIVLPAAAAWDNPFMSESASKSRQSAMLELAQMPSSKESTTKSMSGTFFGSILSDPVRLMDIAQNSYTHRYAHDEESRYNA